MPSDAAEGNALSLPEWDGLESAIERLLEQHASLRERAEIAEGRVRELEAALRDVSAGRIDPVAIAEHAQSLEKENQLLNERLERARHSVQRILGRMRFVEEEP
jgi:predicted RNase H-like nuclease (RuvC/YqgF family)